MLSGKKKKKEENKKQHNPNTWHTSGCLCSQGIFSGISAEPGPHRSSEEGGGRTGLDICTGVERNQTQVGPQVDSGTLLDKVKNVMVCTGSGQRSSEGGNTRRQNEPSGLLLGRSSEGHRS